MCSVLLVVLTKCLLKCPSSTKPPLPWKVLVARLHSGTVLLVKRSILNVWQCSKYASVSITAQWFVCTVTLCYELHQTHLEFCHIQNSIFSGILRVILVYSTPFKKLAYSKLRHITSLSIFKIGGIFKTLWNFEQAYSKPCQSQNGQKNLFRHYSAIFKDMKSLV